MSDTRDIRENTRALIRLERAIEALNKTLVEIERRKQDGSGPLCASCAPGWCIVDGQIEKSEDCACCKADHVSKEIKN
jgi:hypothetical protein